MADNDQQYIRLDEYIAARGLAASRSQAQDLIKRGKVRLGTKICTKGAYRVKGTERVQILEKEIYVSRAGNKLASVANEFDLDFRGRTVLDVGSSTGGFTQFALIGGAKKVYAVDVGTKQLHPKLQGNPKISLHEKTDIRDFKLPEDEKNVDIIVGDVSFISLTKVLPSLEKFCRKDTVVALMAKPQFESEGFNLNHGVVKNSKQRREILDRFEYWLRNNNWTVIGKRDSGLAGSKGNIERFYKLAYHRSN